LFFTAAPVQGVTAAPSGFVNALLFSIRGRQCGRLTVEAYKTLVDHGQAKFYAQAWGQDGIYGDRATVLPVQPFGDITQQLYAAQELDSAAGQNLQLKTNDGTPLQINPTGGRIDITRLSIAHTEEIAIQYTLTASDEVSTEIKGLFIVHPGTQYVEEFTFPLRGRPGAIWGIQATNASDDSLHRINTTAILE
jgi:hypothetical protein